MPGGVKRLKRLRDRSVTCQEGLPDLPCHGSGRCYYFLAAKADDPADDEANHGTSEAAGNGGEVLPSPEVIARYRLVEALVCTDQGPRQHAAGHTAQQGPC